MKSKITDVGIKFKGAKKDKVRSVNNTTDVKVPTVKKSTIWPEPDWASDAVDFYNPNHVFMFMHLYPKISKTPNLKGFKDPVAAIDYYVKVVETLKNCYENPSIFPDDTKVIDPDYRTLLLIDFLKEPLGCKNSTEVVMISIAACNKDKNLFCYKGHKDLNILLKAGFGTDKQIATDTKLAVAEYKWRATKAKFFTITENDKIIKDVADKVVYEFKTKEEAEEQLIKLLKSEWHKGQLLKNVKELTKRPMPIDNECRVGVDYRNGQDVTIAQFTDAFKFRGIEWGEWVTQAERQQFLNCAFDALSDLLNLMDLPLQFASLNGVLGIAFGSRGKAGECAHFDEKELLIHISKTKAIGSLAHEFGHAFDYVISNHNSLPYWYSEVKSINALSSTCDIHNAFSAWANWIDSSACMKDSKDVDKKRSNKYFSTRCELFARCFEQWVQVSLTEKGQSNNFLVYGAIANPESQISVYPRNKEQSESYKLIADICVAIRPTLLNFD